jgi:rhodanese-related sulfurtransferase
MGNNTSSINKVNFEDIQEIIEKNNGILINTLASNNQECLIISTVNISDEEKIINSYLQKNKRINIIIYGLNSNDPTIYNKYNQLLQLGFTNIYLYPGGMFEWMCLQDIYGDDLFPTSKKELDILRFKPVSNKQTLLLTDID